MSNHAWCSNPARDEAVRAAEDGRQGPLLTLEDAIAQPFAEPAQCSPAVSETGETQSGARTERVTLEVTYRPNESGGTTPHDWSWGPVFSALRRGESVRVVEEPDFLDIAQVMMQRDSAIRERDEAKADAEKSAVRIKSQAENVAYFRAERDEARAQRNAAIDERESLREQLESVACRAATAETALEAAPAASGAANGQGEPKSSTSGWLDEVEREALEAARDYFDNEDHGDSECVFIARVLKQILARSTPPEVVLPVSWTETNHINRVMSAKAVIAALAAAGVAVKEAGK